MGRAYSALVVAIGERLLERSLTVREAERRGGLPERRIRNILDGRTPNIDHAAEICDALDLELYIGRPRDLPPPAPSAPGETSAYVSRLSDGFPRRGARFSALGCAWFGAGVLTDLRLDPDFCRAVESLDDSMAPTLPPKSVALTDLRRTELWDGGIFLIGPTTRPMLRRLVRSGNDWQVEADNPEWESRPLKCTDEVMGEALWRSLALPPEPAGERAERGSDTPAVTVTKIETENLRPWPVPYRGRIDPVSAAAAETEEVAWFEIGFLQALGIDPVQAETVTVADDTMAPVLCPLAAVLIDRRRSERRDGAIYLLRTSEGLALRRLIRDGRHWRVTTAGPTFSRPRPLRATDQVLGEAIWTASFLPGSRRS